MLISLAAPNVRTSKLLWEVLMYVYDAYISYIILLYCVLTLCSCTVCWNDPIVLYADMTKLYCMIHRTLSRNYPIVLCTNNRIQLFCIPTDCTVHWHDQLYYILKWFNRTTECWHIPTEHNADTVLCCQAVQTPVRTETGVELLVNYYCQLYFIDKRFFPPDSRTYIQLEWWVYF